MEKEIEDAVEKVKSTIEDNNFMETKTEVKKTTKELEDEKAEIIIHWAYMKKMESNYSKATFANLKKATHNRLASILMELA